MSNLEDPRVLFALERTALAWNRSALALVAFGFVIQKSSLLVQLIDPVKYHDKIVYNHWLGVAVIVFGMVVNVGSLFQYRAGLRSLTEAEFLPHYRTQYPLVLNLFTLLTGLLLIVSFWIH